VEHERRHAGREEGPQAVVLGHGGGLRDHPRLYRTLVEQLDPALAPLTGVAIVGLDGVDADRKLIGERLVLLDVRALDGVQASEERLDQVRQVIRRDLSVEVAYLDTERRGSVRRIGREDQPLAALDVQRAFVPDLGAADLVAPLAVVVDEQDVR